MTHRAQQPLLTTNVTRNPAAEQWEPSRRKSGGDPAQIRRSGVINHPHDGSLHGQDSAFKLTRRDLHDISTE